MTVISSTSFFACDYQWQICKAFISETTVNVMIIKSDHLKIKSETLRIKNQGAY